PPGGELFSKNRPAFPFKGDTSRVRKGYPLFIWAISPPPLPPKSDLQRQSRRQLGISLSGRRFRRRDNRVHAVSQAGPDRAEDVPTTRIMRARPAPSRDQRRRTSGIPGCSRRTEADW